MKMCLTVFVFFVLTTYYVDDITEFLLFPLRAALLTQSSSKVVYLSIFEKALVQFDVSILWAIVFSSPILFFQLWGFIRPGLHDHEVKVVRPFLIFGWALFIIGMAFGYYIVFPFAFKFLIGYGVKDVEATIGLRSYVSLASQILLLLGVMFQFPNILLILGFMGLVTKQLLARLRRFVYVGLAVVAAVFSPPDVLSMIAVWIPLCVLYELGILLVALIVHPYLKKVHLPENTKS